MLNSLWSISTTALCLLTVSCDVFMTSLGEADKFIGLQLIRVKPIFLAYVSYLMAQQEAISLATADKK